MPIEFCQLAEFIVLEFQRQNPMMIVFSVEPLGGRFVGSRIVNITDVKCTKQLMPKFQLFPITQRGSYSQITLFLLLRIY